MKNNLKRILALVITALIILSASPLAISASGLDPAASEERRSTGYRPYKSPGSRAISDGIVSGPRRTSPLPDYYNSNENGVVTSVKSQAYGDCWAHAAMAGCETYMIKNGVNVSLEGSFTGIADTSLDLSENHLCSFALGSCVDPLGIATEERVTVDDSTDAYDIGGNGYFAMHTLMSLNGPANEGTEALKYDSNLDGSFRYDSSYAYDYDAAYVTDVIVIPIKNMEAMKRAIMEYGAGSFGYCSCPNGSFTKYSNELTGASCFIQTAEYGSSSYWYPDHDVTVVGWDDNYSRTNFNSASRPENNGAWIVKNSWGTLYGDSGYYYISYEDSASYNDEAFFYKAVERDPELRIYQYDNITGFEHNYLFSGSSVANAFTAQSDELLDAVAICLSDEAVDYTLKIYTDCSTTDPTSGTLRLTQSGRTDYAGYRRIDLDSAVPLTAGQRYSVVFTLSLPDDGGFFLPVAKDGSVWDSITFDHGEYEYSSYSIPAGDDSWTDDSAKMNYRIKAYTHPDEPVQTEPDWYVDNYKFVIKNGAGINFMRIAPGVLTTSAEIRASEGLIQVDKALCDSKKDEKGVLTYDFMKAGVYSIWVRYDGGDAYILSGVDITNIIPSIGAINGITVTVDDLVLDDETGVKDLWIARGTLDTHSQVKDAANKIVQVSAAKIAQANNNYGRSYTYSIDYKAASESGDYTVCVRYNDNRDPVILHFNVEYPQPEVNVHGLQSTVTALKGETESGGYAVKCVRVAPGEWEDASQVKKAPGVRVFTAKTILKNLEEYTIQYRTNGYYTLSIEYDGGYTVVKTIYIASLVPTVDVNGDNTVTLGGLDDLYIIRYAPNPKNSTDWSQGYFKQAVGNRYAKTADVDPADKIFTTPVLPDIRYKDKTGAYTTCSIWTFMVQYNEESYSIFTVNFGDGSVTWLKQ